MLRWFEYGRVYRPTKEWEASGADLGRPWEDFYFNAPDGVRLNAWFFPAADDSPRRHLAMLICHGNGGNVSHRVELCRVLLKTGASVLVFDYRGYGRSEGQPDEEGTYRDAQGAHHWLQQRGFAPSHIITFGESLGGGIAAELALRETVGGLALQSTYTSIRDLGAELYPWLPVRWLHTIKYDTASKLPKVKVPVLVMHSRNDGLIRFRHGERNFDLANEPKLFWETNGDHNYSLESDHDRCAEGMERFLTLIEATRLGSEISK
jgi:pimeloyl-ACP methyl ester carboxylesterase